MEWQPIETAPKDGAWLLLYWVTMPITLYPFCAFWDDGWWHPSFRDYGEVFPTHWMPLPEPPRA